jgi:hypothetical protein
MNLYEFELKATKKKKILKDILDDIKKVPYADPFNYRLELDYKEEMVKIIIITVSPEDVTNRKVKEYKIDLEIFGDSTKFWIYTQMCERIHLQFAETEHAF